MAVSDVLDGDANNDGQVEGTANHILASVRSINGFLDNDVDNEDNPDGLADPLGDMGLVFLVVPSVGGSLLLLYLYEPQMVSHDYYSPLERPG